MDTFLNRLEDAFELFRYAIVEVEVCEAFIL